MKPNNNTIAANRVCFFILTCFLFNGLMAQAIDFTNLTPDQRKATQSKIEEASPAILRVRLSRSSIQPKI